MADVEEGLKAYLKKFDDQARSVINIKDDVRLASYFPALTTMEKQAFNELNHTRNLEKAFVYFLRFIFVVVEYLPKHPDYREKRHQSHLSELKSRALKAMDEAEGLKTTLSLKYRMDFEEKEKKRREEDAIEPPSFEELEARIASLCAPIVPRGPPLNSGGATASNKQPENSGTTEMTDEERELQELAKWSGEGDETHASSRTGGDSEGTTTPTAAKNAATVATGAAAGLASLGTMNQALPDPPAYPGTGTQPQQQQQQQPYPTSAPQQYPSVQQPQQYQPSNPTAPPHPSSAPLYPSLTTPTQDNSANTVQQGDSGVGRFAQQQLNPLAFSPQMVSDFLQLARENSTNNKETCGILMGSMVANRYVITHVVLPKQVGTPDSCNTLDDLEVFNYAESKGLMTLGWIHTHPSQTAFLSSVDLHTQYGYQAMLPEAVAIVCSIKYQDSQSLRLSDAGLETMAKCKQKGFHPHESKIPLFEACHHVSYDPSIRFEISDMRA